MKQLIEEGSWNENTKWILYHSDEQPDESLCTAVFCVAIDVDNKIVLMKSERGWGMLGGHIEDGETILEALARESQEEGGFSPNQPHLFGFREITSQEPVLSAARDVPYPFPTSYILYYRATTTEPIRTPTGLEVLDSRSFDVEQLEKMNIPDLSTIKLGLEAYSTLHS